MSDRADSETDVLTVLLDAASLLLIIKLLIKIYNLRYLLLTYLIELISYSA